MLSIRVLAAILCATTIPVVLHAQSQTMGSLKLRNGQPATVSLTIPTTSVSGYDLTLPASVGTAGQVLSINAVTGQTATLQWSDAMFWGLTGSSITTGGTAVGEQYIGTSNQQNLVLAANSTEALRVVGVAGPQQGYIGIGTTTPLAPVDIAKTVLLSNSGTATELRFAEPSVSGTNYTAFKAGAQTSDITYTLPDAAAASDGMVLTATTGGVLSWQNVLQNLGKGTYIPTAGAYQHVIATTGFDILANSIPIVSVQNDAGTTIGVSITAKDDIANTLTIETSVPLAITDRIHWVIVNP